MKTASMLALSALLSLAFTGNGQAQLKVAVVNLQKVFDEYKATKKAQEDLNKERNGYKEEHNKRMEDFRKLVEQIKSLREGADDPSLSEDTRKEKSDNLQKKIEEAKTRESEIREFDNMSQKLLRDRFGREHKEIMKNITKEVDEHCKGQYSLVFDTSGATMNGRPTILYSEGVVDLTDELIKKINSK
jgi:Skp family chaperone for outer membrane proteins